MGGRLVGQLPHLVEEPTDPHDSRLPEVPPFLERSQEHQVHAERVRAPLPNVGVGDHHVTPRLGHLRAVLHDEPVRPELGERLFEVDVPELPQHHRDEARVQEVQHGVLVAADVGGDRQPRLRAPGVERPVGEFGRGIPQEVPRGVEERVGDVRLPAARPAAPWARHVVPLLVPGERTDAGVVRPEVLDDREHDGEVALRHAHRPARLAVDDRNRRSPIALARDAPVVQAVLHPRRCRAASREPLDDLAAALATGEDIESARARQHPHLGHAGERLPLHLDHLADGEAELTGELEVALVVRGHGHDGAGAVLHEHVVGDPDRDRLPGRRIAGVGAEEDTRLGLVADFARDDVLALHLPLVGLHRDALLHGDQLLDQRMLGGKHEVRGAEHRVGAGGEHGDLPPGRRLEHELDALAPADPVALQRDSALGPVKPVEVREQPLGVVGDPEEPLLEGALLHRRAAALAAAVDDLLVGKHSLVFGAPVHRRALPVRESGSEQLQEEPLRPLVVGGVGGRELVAPVEHPAEAPQLAPEVLDVLWDQPRRIGADRERVVLRVDPERIEADRLEHVVALQPLEAAVDVRAGEGEHVPHVQSLGRGGGGHHEGVKRRARAVEIGLIGVAIRVASLVTSYLRERRHEAEALAHSPAILVAAQEASQKSAGQGLDRLDVPALERQFSRTRQLGGDPALQRYFREYPQRSDIAALFFTDSHGFTVIASDRTSRFVQSGEEWWQVAVRDGEHEGEAEFDSAANTVAIEYAIAIRAPGVPRPVGAVTAVFGLDKLATLLGAGALGDGAYLHVVDEHGHLLVGPDQSQLLQPVPDDKLIPRRGRPQTAVVPTAHGEELVISIPANRGRWWVLFRQPTGQAYAAARTTQRDIWLGALALLGITVAALVGLGDWLNRRVTEPVRAVGAIASRVAGGDLSVAVVMQRTETGEGRELLSSVHAMVVALRRLVGAIRTAADEAAAMAAEISAATQQMSASTQELTATTQDLTKRAAEQAQLARAAADAAARILQIATALAAGGEESG